MKRISVFLVVIGICFSCKEENPEPLPEGWEFLVGRWKIVDHYTIDDIVWKDYGGDLVDTAYSFFTYSFRASDFTYTFQANPNEVVSHGELQYWVDARYPDLHEKHTVSMFALSEIPSWDIKGDTLILNYAMWQKKRKIAELSDTTFLLREDKDSKDSINGGIRHRTGTVFTLFEKQ